MSRPDEVPQTWTIAGITPGWLLIQGGMLSILTGIAVGLIAGWNYLKAFAHFYVQQSEAAALIEIAVSKEVVASDNKSK